MKGTIVKGTGNSRSIKSVTTLPLAWEDARAQLISSGWPVDLGPLNAAGCKQVGDALNKANLLTDATAALYGLGATAVPDQVLAKASSLISNLQSSVSSNAKIQTGSYTGTSTQTGTTSKTINLSFSPKLVFVWDAMGYGSYSMLFYFGGDASASASVSKGSSGSGNGSFQISNSINTSVSGNSITFTSYFGAAGNSMNYNGYTYKYIAIG